MSSKRFTVDGTVIHDSCGGPKEKVICACGYLQSDADASANHRCSSSCSAPDDHDAEERKHIAATQLAATWNRDDEETLRDVAEYEKGLES